MKMAKSRFLFALPLALWTLQVLAETVQLTCENWHSRLGRLEDRTFQVNFDAQTCNGQPCTISDAELKWQQEGGLMEITINRVTGEGRLSVASQESALYKKCKVAEPKA
jgi:hypothetical protein